MVGDSGWQAGASRHFPPLPQVSANGNVLRSEIVGSIKMRVFLSGMPELRLGLNDKVLFDNTGREYPRPRRPCAEWALPLRQLHPGLKLELRKHSPQ